MATGEASTREAQLRKPFANPFFLYFMFSLLCATLRWQWQGGAMDLGRRPRDISSASASIRVCLARSRLRAELLPHPQRVFVVVAVMQGYLSTYEGEVRIALAARRSERR
ncbi:MAG: hypothetical protein ACR2M4_13770 [Actinomycetota bacterium]